VPLTGAPATVTGGVATGGLAYASTVAIAYASAVAGQIGTAPFRAALPAVPFAAETPGGKTGHARDIATLKALRAR
jgi:hypothetical protein